MTKAQDLTGMRFGRLTVLSRNYDKQKELFDKTKQYKAFWNCLCDCGNTVIVTSSNLKNKTNPTLSCGCYFEEVRHKQKNTKENTWVLDNNNGIAIGTTFDGMRFYIDIEDYDKVKNYCWRISNKGYVIANSRNGLNKIIWLHRLVMNIDDENIFIDHRDWDKTNNRKNNLRIATKSENNINIKRKINNTSGYTGVSLNKNSGKYVARISKNKKRIYLGTFDSFEDAVLARHEAELAIHNEWSGEINRKDFESIIKDNSDAPDMEEAEELVEAS